MVIALLAIVMFIDALRASKTAPLVGNTTLSCVADKVEYRQVAGEYEPISAWVKCPTGLARRLDLSQFPTRAELLTLKDGRTLICKVGLYRTTFFLGFLDWLQFDDKRVENEYPCREG
jgi:hypothetical protein